MFNKQLKTAIYLNEYAKNKKFVTKKDYINQFFKLHHIILDYILKYVKVIYIRIHKKKKRELK